MTEENHYEFENLDSITEENEEVEGVNSDKVEEGNELQDNNYSEENEEVEGVNSDKVEEDNELQDNNYSEENVEHEEKKDATEESYNEEDGLPTVDTNADDEEDEESNNLYAEFRDFLKDNQDITEDVGEKKVIPTGIDLLDAILGGGFGVGCLNILVGNPGSGKSMLAAQTIGNGQKINNGKLLAGFLDSEQSMTTKRLYNLGVKKPKLRPNTDMTVEKVFKYIEGTILFKEEKGLQDTPALIVWDSIANTLTQKEIETNDINQVVGQKARVLSNLVPTYVQKCSNYNICLLAVNQLRENVQIGAFPQAPDLKFLSNKDMPGGQALKFNAFQLVHMTIKSEISRNKGHKYPFDGLVIRTKCVKNKLFTPNIEIELISTYSRGFSNFWTNYNLLANTKRLKSGAWSYLVSLPEKKFRTKNAEKLYNEDAEFRQAFDEASKEAIQHDIIDQYGD